MEVEWRVIACGSRREMRQLRGTLYRDRWNGWSDGRRYGLVRLDAAPVTMLYDDRAGVTLTAAIAWPGDMRPSR